MLGDNAGVLFKIRADNANAIQGIHETERAITGLGNSATSAGAGLTAFANPAGAASAALLTLGAAAIGATVGVFNLAKAYSDFGSKLFDAQAKTGLSAATLSTLSLNADKAGSSFDQVSTTISKFTVLLGQAQQGNEKAQETLDKYNITATDTEAALNQAITAIAAMETVEQRAAAARELFKDKTLALLPVIEQMSGSLSEATKETIRTGQAMTEDGIRAADDFGDALTDLQAQLAAVGRQFVAELLPQITSSMKYISALLVANQGAISAWGQHYANVFRGVIVYANATASGIATAMSGIGRAFGANAAATKSWADTLVSEFGKVIASGGLLFYILSKIGQANPDPGEMGPPNMDKPVLPAMPAMPKLGGGAGGGGRGGGGGGRVESDYEKAVKQNAILLEAYKAGNENLLKENDRKLQLMQISEMEHAQEVARIKLAEVQYEIDLNNELLKLQRITGKEKEETTRKLGLLETQRYGQELQNQLDIRTQQEKDWDAELDAVKRDGDARRANEKERAAARKILEEDLKRIKKLEAERFENFKQWQKSEREQMDPYGVGEKTKKGTGTIADGVNWQTSGGGEFITGIVSGLGAAEKQLPVMQKLGEALSQTFGQVAQAVGSAVKSFVLFGTAGGSFRKFAAEVIASIAQMSVVQAVFELAQGLAMSALFWFTGNPKYAKSATEHYVAAAVFGGIGAVASGAGRAVAGNQFQDGGGAAATQANDPASQNNNFQSGQFGGFGNRLNNTLAAVEEGINTLTTKVRAMRPGEVLGMGVDENPNAVSDGLISGLQNNSRLTGALKRATGDAR